MHRRVAQACAAWVDETTLLWGGPVVDAAGAPLRFSLVSGHQLEVVRGGDGVRGHDAEWTALEVVRPLQR